MGLICNIAILFVLLLLRKVEYRSFISLQYYGEEDNLEYCYKIQIGSGKYIKVRRKMHVTHFVYVVIYAFAIETLENIFCEFLTEKALSSLTQELTPCSSFNCRCLLHSAPHNVTSLKGYGCPVDLLFQKESSFLHFSF